MDEVHSGTEGGDLRKPTGDVEVIDKEKRCESPVFKCTNATKSVRGNILDSSDYDIPSYQVNQSVKSRRTSSKYGSEGNETVLPFSPIFTPIPTASAQFQPPSIHSLGTIVKVLDKSSRNNAKGLPHKVSTKPCELFESLGMNDKDISWVSSMASPPPKQLPNTEFNTIEKATFLPEEKFQNIQPRALFSPNLDEDFDCHPLSFCSESEEDEAYKSNVRLSDVCATLKQLKVKSLDQMSGQSGEDTASEIMLSPVIKIKRKKSESGLRRKKGTLVVSPGNEQHYEFLVGEKILESEKAKSEGESHAIEDDSFQTMSFTSIDELCKTLVTENSNCSVASRLVDWEKTLAITSTSIPDTNTPKTLYGNKTTTNFDEGLALVDDLRSYAKALEEGTIQSDLVENKGTVRFDFGNKDVKVDGAKVLCLEVTGRSEKKVKKSGDESSGWEKMKEYLSESQLNVSDSEIFKTVENLEKTLGSQESNDLQKLTGPQGAGGSHSQNSSIPFTSMGNPETTVEEGKKTAAGYCDGDFGQSSGHDMPSVGFRNVLGWAISVSKEALEKGRNILKDCFEEFDEPEKFLKIGKKVVGREPSIVEKQIGAIGAREGTAPGTNEEALVFADAEFEAECVEKVKGNLEKGHLGVGDLLTVSHKEVDVLLKSSECSSEKVGQNPWGGLLTGEDVEKGKNFMVGCDESWKNKFEKEGKVLGGFSSVSDRERKDLPRKALKEGTERTDKAEASWMMGFMTSSGKPVQVSAKALEKAKALMRECDESLSEDLESVKRNFFNDEDLQCQVLEKGETLPSDCEERTKEKEGGAKVVSVSTEAVEKAKGVVSSCEENEGRSSSGRTSRTAKGLSKGLGGCEGRGTSNAEVFEGEKALASGGDEESAVFGFSTALGNKIKISSTAIEKAKSFWYNSEESEGIEFPVKQGKVLGAESSDKSETVGSKAGSLIPKELKKDRNKAEESEKRNCVGDGVTSLVKGFSGSSQIDKRPKGDVSGRKSPDEFDDILPEWLHVYTTSPSVVSDRTELSPLAAQEEDGCWRCGREYIVRSPVLGPGDRFQGKRKKRKVRLEGKSEVGFVVPYKESGKKAGVKRTSELELDFSVPFKRVKMVEVEGVGYGVREGRARRREEQENVIREKQSVKPCKGSHLRKKCSEKQKSWAEAVGGSLPEVHSEEALKGFGVLKDVVNVTVENAASFIFKGEQFFGASCGNTEGIVAGDGCVLILDEDNNVGVGECKRGFLASGGVQPSLVPEGWVENHYKWIVWKLAHYEKSFPQFFAGRCLTPNNVLLQLKYRYDREIDRNERSALRKILERDDTPAKRMVLCVCGIKKTGDPDASSYELTLTDGWYSCPARPDAAMVRILEEGKLKVGTKILTQGAVLVNDEQGVSPLEIGEDVYLRISTNSTRRVKWDTKLGFQKNPKNFVISLSSILVGGGPISRIDVILVRVYPVLYMEKTPDGHHVTRNRRSEEKADAEYRRIQEQKMESICNEVRMEMRKPRKFGKKSTVTRLNKFDQEDDMNQTVEGSCDHSDFREESDRFSRELSEKIEKRLEKEKVCKRNVSEFFRAKVVDMRKPDYNSPAVLSVWHPNEEVTAMLAEGKVVSLLNVTMSNSSRTCKPLQMNTTRQTQYIPIRRNVKYPARRLTQLKDVSSKICPAFGEVDLVGVVVFVEDKCCGSRLSQVIYLTDLEMNFVGVVFWESCKSYGWENVLKISSVVACINLQWKKSHVSQDVPSLYVNENSIFTENPKCCYLKEEMQKLKENKSRKLSSFVSKCEEELTARLEESKWRANSRKNPSANESTLRESNPSMSNVNGFESKPTASSTPIKPFNSKVANDEPEPSPVQERIEKLQAYGEPPPLIPLIISRHPKRKLRKNNLRT